MTDMVERVARAIAETFFEPGYDWTCFKEEARAAIEAMRSPGEDFASYLQLAHDLRPQDWSELIDAALTPSSAPSPQLGPSENTGNSEGL